MIFNKATIEGVYTIEMTPFKDNRGFFGRTFCAKEFEQHNLKTNMVQTNHSGSFGKGLIRGMHYQRPPYAEVKLIKCVKGAIFDVIVDIRKGSPTFLKWFGAELTAENKMMMYVPEGFAHGFQALTEETELIYQVSSFYNKESEGGIRFNDPRINIDWKLDVSLTSEKDANWDLLDDNFEGLEIKLIERKTIISFFRFYFHSNHNCYCCCY
jgi:dTDP-4-dehydrorhamnose 3,5-epimerase